MKTTWNDIYNTPETGSHKWHPFPAPDIIVCDDCGLYWSMDDNEGCYANDERTITEMPMCSAATASYITEHHCESREEAAQMMREDEWDREQQEREGYHWPDETRWGRR